MNQESIHNPHRGKSWIPEEPSAEMLPKRQEVNFEVWGGTWWMREDQKTGVRSAEGVLSDAGLYQIQEECGVFDTNDPAERAERNKKVSERLYEMMREPVEADREVGKQLGDWCKDEHGRDIGQFVAANMQVRFGGDSSQMGPEVLAPLLRTLFDTFKSDPKKPKIIGMGTDAADRVIPLVDAFLFDLKNAPPVLFSGANNPPNVPGSDAPANFMSAARLAGKRLGSANKMRVGWVFGDYLYGELEKFDPTESLAGGIQGQTTFVSSHGLTSPIKTLLETAPDADYSDCEPPPQEHAMSRVTHGELYDAIAGVTVIDLGEMNPGEAVLKQINDPSIKAVVVAGHGLGNANNQITHDLAEAAKRGVLIILVSRALMGDVAPAYAASMLSANEKLTDHGVQIIDGGILTKGEAHGLAIRMIVDSANSESGQALVDKFLRVRKGLKRSQAR